MLSYRYLRSTGAINITVGDIECRIWKHFVDMTHNSGKYSSARICECTFSMYSVLLFMFLIRSDCAEV